MEEINVTINVGLSSLIVLGAVIGFTVSVGIVLGVKLIDYLERSKTEE